MSKLSLEMINDLNLPDNKKSQLKGYIREYIEKEDLNLVEIAVYGGVVLGNYDPKNSDINVLFVLQDIQLSDLEKMAEITKRAWREIRLEPFILDIKEIERGAILFPSKIHTIQDSHVKIFGEEYFKDVKVNNEMLIHRIRQELQNILHRMRRRYLFDNEDPYALNQKLRQISSSLITQLKYLLVINNDSLDRSSTIDQVLKSGMKVLNLPDISELAIVKQIDYYEDETTKPLYERTLTAIENILDYIDQNLVTTEVS